MNTADAIIEDDGGATVDEEVELCEIQIEDKLFSLNYVLHMPLEEYNLALQDNSRLNHIILAMREGVTSTSLENIREVIPLQPQMAGSTNAELDPNHSPNPESTYSKQTEDVSPSKLAAVQALLTFADVNDGIRDSVNITPSKSPAKKKMKPSTVASSVEFEDVSDLDPKPESGFMVIVNNLPLEFDEEHFLSFLNKTLKEADLVYSDEAAVKIEMISANSALLEMSSAENATLCHALEGVVYEGLPMSFLEPWKNYQDKSSFIPKNQNQWSKEKTRAFVQQMLMMQKHVSEWSSEDFKQMGAVVGMSESQCKAKKRYLFEYHSRLLKMVQKPSWEFTQAISSLKNGGAGLACTSTRRQLRMSHHLSDNNYEVSEVEGLNNLEFLSGNENEASNIPSEPKKGAGTTRGLGTMQYSSSDCNGNQIAASNLQSEVEKGRKWTLPASHALLELYTFYHPYMRLDGKEMPQRHAKIWKLISDKLQSDSKGVHLFSAEQCKRRVQSLTDTFQKMTDLEHKSGSGASKYWPFWEKMSKMHQSSVKINPKITVSFGSQAVVSRSPQNPESEASTSQGIGRSSVSKSSVTKAQERKSLIDQRESVSASMQEIARIMKERNEILKGMMQDF